MISEVQKYQNVKIPLNIEIQAIDSCQAVALRHFKNDYPLQQISSQEVILKTCTSTPQGVILQFNYKDSFLVFHGKNKFELISRKESKDIPEKIFEKLLIHIGKRTQLQILDLNILAAKPLSFTFSWNTKNCSNLYAITLTINKSTYSYWINDDDFIIEWTPQFNLPQKMQSFAISDDLKNRVLDSLKLDLPNLFPYGDIDDKKIDISNEVRLLNPFFIIPFTYDGIPNQIQCDWAGNSMHIEGKNSNPPPLRLLDAITCKIKADFMRTFDKKNLLVEDYVQFSYNNLKGYAFKLKDISDMNFSSFTYVIDENAIIHLG